MRVGRRQVGLLLFIGFCLASWPEVNGIAILEMNVQTGMLRINKLGTVQIRGTTL